MYIAGGRASRPKDTAQSNMSLTLTHSNSSASGYTAAKSCCITYPHLRIIYQR